ncbi:class I SAM-dependent methyltransferase [Nocardioides zeae]|uniref:Class I SAM-dependent methyltransferase n=1 Tax=Nocardioides zeae TaxID=1457234 RepID=A0A6P0HJH9_9ACTN|nr:class I SAM-dependent methyltransferase [Nocardioides zeae]NEN77795.1 class I SAM-dependent methyltransferase [Nocardioides zeae]
MSEPARCRVCGEGLAPFLDLGEQPLSNDFATAEESSDFRFHLEIAACTGCTMVQMVHEVPRELMFREDYPYLSSGSTHMAEHFEAAARDALERELRIDDPFVVELGCNDGVYLKHVAAAGVRHLGVEPSAAVARRAASLGVDVRVDFFDEELAREVRAKEGPAKVVFAANTLCHIPYIGSVLAGVEALLHDDGVFCFEDPYLGDILATTAFDQFYDEHFYYFSVHSVQAMARRHGLELVDVAPQAVHGGELRYTLARAGARTPAPAVEAALEQERAAGVTDPARLREFGERVRTNADELVAVLEEARAAGRSVAAYGATAKSATVLNYCGIGPDLVPVVYDSSPTKQGRVTPGSGIPVVPSEGFRASYPDIALLFAWNHATEIRAKEQGFADAGGSWLTYVPRVQVD